MVVVEETGFAGLLFFSDEQLRQMRVVISPPKP
jgi:hypothetical protein